MARIQVLPLPTQKVGDYERIPFILILDQCDRTEEDWSPELLEGLRADTGAVSIIAHEATLDAPGSLVLTDEERDQLREYLLAPLRGVLGTGQDPDRLTPPPIQGPLHATP